MAKTSVTDEFDGVDFNDEVPPDVPKGTYQALCNVRKAKTQAGDPMLALEWRVEAAIDGAEEAVGRRATDVIIFPDRSSSSLRMQMLRVKELCAALNLDPPRYTSKQREAMADGDWSAVAGFIDQLNGCRAQITTDPKPDKTGIMRDNVRYSKKSASLPPPATAEKKKLKSKTA